MRRGVIPFRESCMLRPMVKQTRVCRTESNPVLDQPGQHALAQRRLRQLPESFGIEVHTQDSRGRRRSRRSTRTEPTTMDNILSQFNVICDTRSPNVANVTRSSQQRSCVQSARIDDHGAMTCAETRSSTTQKLRLLNYVNIYSTLVKQRA
jgi:hypothetical protein